MSLKVDTRLLIVKRERKNRVIDVNVRIYDKNKKKMRKRERERERMKSLILFVTSSF